MDQDPREEVEFATEEGWSDWSDWVWSEEQGYSYSTRCGPDGEIEYDYLYPEPDAYPEETPRYTPVGNWDTQDPDEHTHTSADTPAQYTTVSPAEGSSSNVGSQGWGVSADYGGGASPGSPSSMRPAYTVPSSSSSGPYAGSSSHNDAVGDATASAFQNLSLQELPEVPVQAPSGETKFAKHITSGSTSNHKGLDSRYVQIDERKNKKFWKPGRVFMMLWTEPAAPNSREGGATTGSHYAMVWLNERVYSEIRRFVVIGEGYGNVICSPIHTYSGQATLKENLPDPQQHAIIHTSSKPPAELCEYDADGNVVLREELSKDSIRVVSELPLNDPDGDLGKLSRINYAKIYTVEKYVRVRNIGRVHEASMESLLANCFFARPEDEPPQGPRNKHRSKGHSDNPKREDRGRTSKHGHHQGKHRK